MPHKTSDFESYGSDHLTFDCPWCGAISGIDPSHRGESFTCPECQNATKLTSENTRRSHLTEAPPDAPHHEEEARQAAAAAAEAARKKKAAHEISAWESYGRNHLTFDCPWCGAISGVDPSHLGEHYDCPECHKATKLTESTTRKSEIADPPKDAPHHEESTGSRLPLVLGIGVLAVAAVIIAVLSSKPSGDGDGDGEGEGTPVTVAGQPNESDPISDPISDPAPGPAQPLPAPVPANAGEPASPPPEDAPPVVASPPEEAAPEEPPAEPPVEAPPSAVQEAEAALAAAKQAFEAWKVENPEAARCLSLSVPCGQVTEELQRLFAELDPAAATVADARAFDEAVHGYIAADPNRMLVAEQLAAHLDAARIREPAVGSWERLNFFEPRVRETLLRLHEAMCAVDPTEYTALEAAVTAAEEALAAAKADDAAGDEEGEGDGE